MDEGVVEYCDCISTAITSPLTWNFNTPINPVDPLQVTGDPGLLVVSTTYDSCPDGEFRITFNGPVAVGSGTITFGGAGSVDASTGTLVGSTTINYGTPTLTLQADTEYTITIPQGVATVDDGCSTGPSRESTRTFTTNPPLLVTDVIANSYTFEPDNDEDQVNRQSNVGIVFNQNIRLGPSGTISIGGHQTFNVAQTFSSNKISELFWTSNNTLWLNPTVDLTPGSSYTITASGTPVRAQCGAYWDNSFGSIDNTIVIDPGPTAQAPVVNLTDGVVDVPFDRDIAESGTSSILLLDENGSVVNTITSGSTEIV
jgi:hypothetical protein